MTVLPNPAPGNPPANLETVEIELINGRGVMLVDAADEDLVRPFRWRLMVTRTDTRYAIAGQYRYGNQIRAHRLIMQAPPEMWVDHRNGDGLDNRRSNLRLATHHQNQRNQRANRGGSSQYLGVSWHRKKMKWGANIRVDGTLVSLGYFLDEQEAALAYDNAAREIFGEFARPNLGVLT